MDHYTIVAIIEQLKEFDMRKARKLAKLEDKYLSEKDANKKKYLGKRIRSLIYRIFLDCIDRDLGNELSNLNVCINTDEYELEQREKQWFINSKGARRLKVQDDKFIEIDMIPREYGEGFMLQEDSSDEAKRFYMTNHAILSDIAKQIDRKEEIITYYQPVDRRIPREFTETLVDFIGFDRIKSEDNKKATTK